MTRSSRSRIAVAGALLVALVLALFVTLGSDDAATTGSASAATAAPRASVAPPPPLTQAGGPIQLITPNRLVVAVVNLNRYPFFYLNARGELVGSDIDLARSIASELGAEVTFNRSATTFDGVVSLVAKGEADVGISKLSITLARASQVRFTQPYIELAQGLLLNRVELTATGGGRNTDVISVLNQPQRRLGAVKGTSYVGFGHTLFPEAELVEFLDKEALFQAVLDGAVTGVLYDENEIKQYIFEKPDRLINLKVEMLPGHTDPIAIAVRDSQLQYWLDTYLSLKRVKFAVNDLLTKYPRP